jgi:nucleotide-binding universal stress UspA family protein
MARTAQQTQADLVVLGTHGKRGMGAFWSGNAAMANRVALSVRCSSTLPDCSHFRFRRDWKEL